MESEDGIDENLVDRLKQVEALLDEYEKKIHIDKIKLIEPDLSISKEVLASMHWEDIKGLTWEYAQYTLALQKEINRHQSRFNWAEANLKRYVEREANEYKGWSWQERQAEALNSSEFAQRLHNLKVKSKLAIDRLAFLPAKLEFLTKIAEDIMKAKRYKHVETE